MHRKTRYSESNDRRGGIIKHNAAYESASMKYKQIWEKVLSDRERVEYEFSIGRGYKKFNLILWSVLGVILLIAGIGVFILAIAWLYYGFYVERANVYAFTDKRILQHRGWLSTRTISIDYRMITDVHVREPFFQRVFTHTGSLSVDTASSNKLHHEISFRNVDAPYELKKRLDLLRTAR
jgi:uncharacterized membrane protein YdbT with pleckstrin-like domain